MITWRNIDAPDVSQAAGIMQQGVSNIQNSFDTLRKMAEGYVEKGTAANTASLMEDIRRNVTDMDSYNQYDFNQAAAQYGGYVNKQEALDRLLGMRGDFQSQANQEKTWDINAANRAEDQAIQAERYKVDDSFKERGLNLQAARDNADRLFKERELGMQAERDEAERLFRGRGLDMQSERDKADASYRERNLSVQEERNEADKILRERGLDIQEAQAKVQAKVQKLQAERWTQEKMLQLTNIEAAQEADNANYNFKAYQNGLGIRDEFLADTTPEARTNVINKLESTYKVVEGDLWRIGESSGQDMMDVFRKQMKRADKFYRDTYGTPVPAALIELSIAELRKTDTGNVYMKDLFKTIKNHVDTYGPSSDNLSALTKAQLETEKKLRDINARTKESSLRIIRGDTK